MPSAEAARRDRPEIPAPRRDGVRQRSRHQTGNVQEAQQRPQRGQRHQVSGLAPPALRPFQDEARDIGGGKPAEGRAQVPRSELRNLPAHRQCRCL